MSVVFVGSSASVFVSRSQEELQRRGISVSILDPFTATDEPAGGAGVYKKLVRQVSRYRTVQRLMGLYPIDSVVMVHYLSLDCAWLVPLLKTRFCRVIGMAYGSDILRRRHILDLLLGHGLKRLDAFAATNTNVLEALVEGFPSLAGRSVGIVRFGLPVFDEILKLDAVSSRQAKAALGFDPSKRVASLGYAASPGQRQLELIDFFSTRLAELDDLDFVVPVQYGSPETIAAVTARCDVANFNAGATRFRPLTEFHGPERAALMRRATDVLVNHSVTDAFSGTVQEVIYAGNLVLAASHLPYEKMPGFETALFRYEGLDETAKALRADRFAVLAKVSTEAAKTNRAALHAISSWDAVLPDWQRLLGVGPS